MANDNRFISAVKRETMEMLDEERKKRPDTKKTENFFTKAAVARVSSRPWDFIFMGEGDRGYCGLGGKP